MIEVQGHTAHVSFDGWQIVITRAGWRGAVGHGRGEQVIPIGAVQAVQWKPAGLLTNGYIAFTVAGGQQISAGPGSRTVAAVRDPNAVVFTRRQRAGFERLKQAVRAAVAAQRGGGYR